MIWPEINVVSVLVSDNGFYAVSQVFHLEAWSEWVWIGLNGIVCGLIWRVFQWRPRLGKDRIVLEIRTNQFLDCFVMGSSDWEFCSDPIWDWSRIWKPESSFVANLLLWRYALGMLHGFQWIDRLKSGMRFSDTILRRFLNLWVSDLRFLVIEKEPIGYLRRGVLEETKYLTFLCVVSGLSRWEKPQTSGVLE